VVKQVRVRELTDWEKGWLAGVIDSEGTIKLYVDKQMYGYKTGCFPRIRACVVVTNTYLPFVEKIKEIVGCGGITTKKPSGNHYGKKLLHIWHLEANADVLRLLEQISAYLILKKKSAENIVEYLSTKRPYQPLTEEQFEKALQLVSNVNTFNETFGKRSFRRKPWTEEQITILKQIYAHTSWEELEKTLRHPMNAIVDKASQLGLYRRKFKMVELYERSGGKESESKT